MIKRMIDSAALTVGVLLMAAVSVALTAPLWAYDAVRGRHRHAGRRLDYVHIDQASGNRLPIGDDETVRSLVRRGWQP